MGVKEGMVESVWGYINGCKRGRFILMGVKEEDYQ